MPLGPFLGKNFASTISPWVVSVEALEPYRVDGPVQEPEVLPYLRYDESCHYDIQLEVFVQPASGQPIQIVSSNARHLYWNVVQQVAHHTVNGCSLRVGDILATGTISGPVPPSWGSLLELTYNGTKPIDLVGNRKLGYLEDGDTVILKGHCGKGSRRVGFGEARATVLPSVPINEMT